LLFGAMRGARTSAATTGPAAVCLRVMSHVVLPRARRQPVLFSGVSATGVSATPGTDHDARDRILSRRPDAPLVSPQAFAAALDRIAALEGRIVALEGRHRAHDARHRAALVALATVARGRTLPAKVFIERAHDDRDLQATLIAAGLYDEQARKLGRWLRVVQGRAIDGIRVEHAGRDEDGVGWSFLTQPR
jgi:hypothetical protein